MKCGLRSRLKYEGESGDGGERAAVKQEGNDKTGAALRDRALRRTFRRRLR